MKRHSIHSLETLTRANMQVLNHEYVRVCVEVAEVKGEGEWQVVYIVIYSIYIHKV